MTLQDFKLKMTSELSSIYEMDELNSIFNLLSEHYLNIPRSKILLANDIGLNEANQTLFLSALERLKNHEPIQYVLGKTTFMDLEFKVNGSVLIPRPETEELVRLMLKEDLNGKEILDIGTGSGCVAISLAKNLPKSRISALDISCDALEVARENAKLNNVDIEFINSGIFEYKSKKKYDIIVSNPPYVIESEKLLMKQNVLKYEPHIALFVDDSEPLKYYESIINLSSDNLNPKGLIFFEINENYKHQLNKLAQNYEYNIIEFKLDIHNKNRFLILSKQD